MPRDGAFDTCPCKVGPRTRRESFALTAAASARALSIQPYGKLRDGPMPRKISYQELRCAVLRRVFRQPAHYADVAQRQWSLAPAVTLQKRAAIYLDGELEKIGAVQEDTTLEAELARLAAGKKHHVETKAYQFSDVHLQGGRLFKGAVSHRLSHLTQVADRAEEQEIESAAIASTLLGSLYFGHWMRDDSTLQLAVRSLAPTINIARQTYSHEAGYRDLLALTEHRVERARVRQLILLDDWGHNHFKRKRFAELRATFQRAVPPSGNERVYIRRGRAIGARGRDMLNTTEVEEFLAAHGFTMVNPDTMSADEIARTTNGAKLVVGLEGSHLGHAIFPIADGGTLLVLQPPLRFNNPYKDVSDTLDLHYAFTVGAQEQDGFRIDLARLGRLLERIPS
jgi:hypothetical protein